MLKKFLATLVTFFAITVSTHSAAGSEQRVNIMPEPVKVADFTLTDHNGNVFNNESLKGKTTVMFFGYTSCPDICPTTLSMLKLAKKEIKKSKEDTSDLQFVFVSVDPDRDSLAKLKDFSKFFGDFIIGATGDYDEFERLAVSVGAHFQYNDPNEETGFYIVDHSAEVYVLNGNGELIADLPQPHYHKGVAEAVLTLSK